MVTAQHASILNGLTNNHTPLVISFLQIFHSLVRYNEDDFICENPWQNKQRFGSIIFVSRLPAVRDLPASVIHSHEICDTVQPVHKRWTRLVIDTPWASSTGLAARPSQSFPLALLDLSCEPAPGSLPPRVAGTSETSFSEELYFLPGKCCLFSILLLPKIS